jgi:hypothetical protein
MGITGWMLSTLCVRAGGPAFKFRFSWNGTLIRLPTGFWCNLRQILLAQCRVRGCACSIAANMAANAQALVCSLLE